MMIKNTNLVIGCGLSGSVIARLLAENGEKVLIIDKKIISQEIYMIT